ncbi:hypothetical protein HY642_05675 [Candidatus Woesearchaeota archaeon]|nr:hypothetical protein [Candidatus Woesearchaeota archaeon]
MPAGVPEGEAVGDGGVASGGVEVGAVSGLPPTVGKSLAGALGLPSCDGTGSPTLGPEGVVSRTGGGLSLEQPTRTTNTINPIIPSLSITG